MFEKSIYFHGFAEAAVAALQILAAHEPGKVITLILLPS